MEDKSGTIGVKRYMNLEQLCEYLNVSYWTIYRLINKREIPFATIGKRQYRFDQTVIDGWMKDRTMKTVDQV